MAAYMCTPVSGLYHSACLCDPSTVCCAPVDSSSVFAMYYQCLNTPLYYREHWDVSNRNL